MTLIQFEGPRAVEPDEARDLPLIPVPDQREALDDAEVLEAWHVALTVAVAEGLPHDLLGLWVYPAAGGARLLGPAALAADELRVPTPDPRVPASQRRLLEEILLDAGYGSARCLPVRAGRRDVGLLLLGAFRADAFDEARTAFARTVARTLAPTLARLADADAPPDRRVEEAESLARLGHAVATAQSPRAFASEVGLALAARLPVRRLELLIAGNDPNQTYRLDEHEEGALWSRASLIVPKEVLAPRVIVGDAPAVIVADAQADPRWRAWAADGVRSVLAVRLATGGRLQGFLLLAADADGLYDEDDAAFAAGVAPWVAARVEGLVETVHLRTARAQLAASHAVPNQLRRMATALATTAGASEALRDYFAEATALLPFHRVRLVVPHGADRATMLVPGDLRPFAEQPVTTLGAGLVRRVLEGEAPHGAVQGGSEVDLVFPMRAAGRVVGAMILTTGTPGAFTRNHLALAQQVADGAAWVIAMEVGSREPAHLSS